MRKIALCVVLFISSVSIGQTDSPSASNPNFNRWSIDLNTGLNKSVRNFASGYSSSLADFGELNIGVRRMFNAYGGLDLKFGFDRFHDGKASPDFATNMGRVSLDGIVNVGNLLNFYQWTERFGLLFHAGVGVGNFVDKGFPLVNSTVDKVGSVSMGLTPQIKLGNKWAVNLDASVTGLARMHHTFDYTANNQIGGINGQFFSGTVGISYYIGKKEQHADWMPTKSVSKDDLDALKAENDKMRLGMNDDDKDGVPNYLDEETNTPEGTPVNKRGIADASLMDKDADGIADAMDHVLTKKGPFSTNGCPDKDGDGVEDSKDKCPTEIGSRENEGCAGSKAGIAAGDFSMNSKFKPVYFPTASATLSQDQKSRLDAIAVEMKNNLATKLIINGHADERGEIEFNQNLSNQRAKSAKNYLVNKGIAASRIETNGYGESKPADTNNTENGRAMNRRVEFLLKN